MVNFAGVCLIYLEQRSDTFISFTCECLFTCCFSLFFLCDLGHFSVSYSFSDNLFLFSFQSVADYFELNKVKYLVCIVLRCIIAV